MPASAPTRRSRWCWSRGRAMLVGIDAVGRSAALSGLDPIEVLFFRNFCALIIQRSTGVGFGLGQIAALFLAMAVGIIGPLAKHLTTSDDADRIVLATPSPTARSP
jgi:hypothetical protein